MLPSNIDLDDDELALQQVCLCQVDAFLFGGCRFGICSDCVAQFFLLLTFGNLYHFCVAEPPSGDKDKYYPKTVYCYLVSSLVLVHQFFAPSIFFSCFIIKVSVFCFQALALSMGTPLEFAGTGETQNQSDWTRNKKIKVSKNIGVAERGKDLHSALAPDVSGHRQRWRKQKVGKLLQHRKMVSFQLYRSYEK